MDRQESEKEVELTCYGSDTVAVRAARSSTREAPGEYCFPPLASLITSGGRLLLALSERLVTDRGGTHAMEDTDSMAIVAHEHGGLIACPGGPYRMDDGQRRRSAHCHWEQVAEIAGALLSKLEPVPIVLSCPALILKIEEDNFDPETKAHRQLVAPGNSPPSVTAALRRDRNGEPAAAAPRRQYPRGERRRLVTSTASAICSIRFDPTQRRSAAGSRRHGWASCADRSALRREPLPFADRVASVRSLSAVQRCCGHLAKLNDGQAVRATDQTVQLHPKLPHRAVRASGRRRSGALSTSLRRTKLTRASGSRCHGSISIRASSIGSARRSPTSTRQIARVKSLRRCA